MAGVAAWRGSQPHYDFHSTTFQLNVSPFGWLPWVVPVVSVTETAQMELKSGRVQAPDSRPWRGQVDLTASTHPSRWLHRSGLCPSLSLTRVRFPLLAKRFARDLSRFSKLQTFEIPEGMGSQ